MQLGVQPDVMAIAFAICSGMLAEAAYKKHRRAGPVGDDAALALFTAAHVVLAVGVLIAIDMH